jgi:hypothetical protein
LRETAVLHQESTDARPRRRPGRHLGERLFRRSFVALAIVLELTWLVVVGYALVRWVI